ncbi:serine/threonine-protein kinase [Acrocarpospora catenulata]|uniref:serine/threonine-protein kinase n=1 Tax=Acrocarpospora catenulata TaxID=2836182 RepID=UPI001BDA1212|nr:serine/threonine-protein kinase [Acrocarpospora catenulata]
MESRAVELLAGRYRLVEALGQGGAGTVWHAHDELLRREVAVKQMRVPDGLTPAQLAEYTGRALGEARAAGRLSHPAIVMIHDVVPHRGQPWIVMDLVPGTSLDKLIPLPSERVAEIGLNILDALELAHRNGILHRDVKPANVLVAEDGRAMLADFGIAAPLGADPADSSGSPAYMAPERFRAEPAGPPSDLWSLGATLYMAVEGRGPFHRDLPAAVVAAVLMHEPPPMIRATPGLARVVLALLDKDPARRPPAPAVRHLLQSLLPAPVVVRPRRTGRLIAWGALAVAVGVGAGLGAWMLASGGPGAPGRFAALPDPCQSLTQRQVDELLGAGADAEDRSGDSCRWVHHRDGTSVQVSFWLSPPGSGEDAAGRAFAQRRAGSGGSGGSGASAGAEDLPGIADEAFTRDVLDPVAPGAAVSFRRSNLIVEVVYGQASASGAPPPSQRTAARQAAARAAQLIGAGLG